MSTGPALVRFDDLARTFGRGPRAVVAVHGASGQVAPGDRIALVGVSGSGKSSLLHLLAGLDAPTAGRIAWPALGDPTALRRSIGVVFQAQSLLPALNVTENVALPLVLRGTPRVAAQQAAADALRRLRLGSLDDRLPEELSEGQAQRVAVARVLVSRPTLILADEPTGQLDHRAGEEVIDALIGSADETEAALVVATHDVTVAERFHRRWVIDDGRLDTTDEATCWA